MWGSHSVVKRAVNTWRFPFHIVVCRVCGFCFVSPGPHAGDLARYHAEGLEGHKGIGLAYSIDARMTVLERYATPGGVFAEIGSDGSTEFHRRCANLFGTLISVEVATDTPAEYRHVGDLPANTTDVVAHYDVLEHVPNVREFLAACYRALKPGGVMVCEMPDIRLYPRNLLLLEFEHVNHFSVTTLASIAASVGFTLMEVEHACSRPFGLLSVFRKTGGPVDPHPHSRVECLDALACIKGGLAQVRRNAVQIDSLRSRVTGLCDSGGKVTLWGVTDLLRRFLDGYARPQGAVVVDSDPRRRTHLEDEGIVVLEPRDAVEHIAGSQLLAVFAPRYKAEIIEAVTRVTGRVPGPAEVVVVGSGVSGETLT
jgi:SAM-dependent methyltransferase